ncbi:MAG: hypothetical protein CVU38_09830 [Chloroflexi bacterium HGW-Chloroflexi-1]|nr:MAG: hypothetical protein CVU38_09830 [Chloroflexi bacterium HGW-Chloroflexi-1]
MVMKKGRPAVVLSVLCRPADTVALRELIFAETTTLGIRSQQVARHCLPRTSVTVTTAHGDIRVKVARWAGGEKAAPEYEDCRRAAQAAGVPLRVVYEAALAEHWKIQASGRP